MKNLQKIYKAQLKFFWGRMPMNRLNYVILHPWLYFIPSKKYKIPDKRYYMTNESLYTPGQS